MVNVGAGTCACDLKNTYGPIRVSTTSGFVETRLAKLGCFVGDHAKLAAGTVAYPGSSVGVASHVYGVVAGDVPSFTTWSGYPGSQRMALTLDSALETRRRMMARRRLLVS